MGKNRLGGRKGARKNSQLVMHAGLNRQRKICARVCVRARLSERPRRSLRGVEWRMGDGNREDEEHERENERSRARQIARSGEFTIFRCRFL